MAKMEDDFTDTKFWCTRPHNWEKIILANASTMADSTASGN